MNKKIALFLSGVSLLGLSLTLGGCHEEKTIQKTKPDFGVIRSTSLDSITKQKEIEYDEIASKIDKKESFVLCVYKGGGCSCWDDFHPILTKYMNAKNINVEYIDVAMFNNKDTFNMVLTRADMPSIILFTKGEIYRQIIYGRSSDTALFHEKNFFKWMDENLRLPNMYLVEKDMLETYFSEEKEMLLYVARSECGDCKTVNQDILYDWSYNYTGNECMYVLDLQKYRDTDVDVYNAMKDWIGLSTVNNPVLGYDTGAVPTFQKRKGAQILDMIVTNNDGINVVSKTVNSYFTQERVNAMPFLQGETKIKTILDKMEVSQEMAEGWYSEKTRFDFYKEYHYPILNKFLSTYLPNVK